MVVNQGCFAPEGRLDRPFWQAVTRVSIGACISHDLRAGTELNTSSKALHHLKILEGLKGHCKYLRTNEKNDDMTYPGQNPETDSQQHITVCEGSSTDATIFF